MKTLPHFSTKQTEFILNSTKKYNITHGAVRSGKTVCTAFRFLELVDECPGSSIFIIGYSLSTIYRNVISLFFDSDELKMFAPFCHWRKGDHTLLFKDKEIKCIGGGDEGALGIIQGLTIDLCLCDEMTLYPENVIYMIDSRLSREHSKLLATMNPKQPEHILKKWIDRAERGDPLYYSLHFTIAENPFLPEHYAANLKENLRGLFYKRNYLGLWCMAEGAIFDHFDRKLHVRSTAPSGGTDYYIAGVDFGTSLCFACVLVGVSTGRHTQTGKKLWVEKEYYWDVSVTHRQKTNSEYLRDVKEFLADYPVTNVYADPSATGFILEMRRGGLHVVEANNDVLEGIQKVSMLIGDGTLCILDNCRNLIGEIEGYVWDTKKGERGIDAPIKKHDHAVDALRYAVVTHKVTTYWGGDDKPIKGWKRYE